MDEALNRLLENSKNKKELRPADIPPLDLYMDQIISLMCSHLDSVDDKEPLTRTMIHNYSKAGLIAPVKGKKYSKTHILQMLAIYSLKNTLSIAQIKRVLSGIEQSGGGETELTHSFDAFLDRRSSINDQLTAALSRILSEEGIQTDTPEQVLSFLLTLTDITDTLTRFAAGITLQYFPDPPQKGKK